VQGARHPASALVLIAALVTTAAAQPARPDWRGTGVVVAVLPPPSDLHATRPMIVLRHEAIPGLMAETMVMPFIAASVALLDGLRPGDPVAFGLKKTSDALLVISIEQVRPAPR
jgi:Cu/Ag efflux protein CusF